MKSSLILAAALALLAAAAVPSGAATSPEEEKLYREAKKEGEVDFRGPTERTSFVGVARAWSKRYPDVKLKYSRQPTGKLVKAVEAEFKAGKLTHEVVHVTDPVILVKWKKAGKLLAYKSPNYADYEPQYLDKDFAFAAMGVTPMLPLVNKKFIAGIGMKPGDLKCYKDFTNPKFAGKQVVTHANAGGTALFAAMRMTELFGWEFHETLRKQNILLGATAGVTTSLVIKGERPVTYAVTGYRALEHGNDPKKGVFTFWPCEGAVMINFAMTILKDGATRHPNAARLLVTWLSSKEGQTNIVEHAHFFSGRKDVKPVPGAQPLHTYKNLWWPDLEKAIQEHGPFLKKFDQVYGLK